MNIILLFCIFIGSVWSKAHPSISESPSCGYSSCHAVDNEKVNVHIVAHSHDDVGWLKTVDQYFYQNVQYTITSMISALQVNPDRKFIQAETAYFYLWWKLQNNATKSEVTRLINTGQLEIVSGAWSQNDEAATHYQSIIDQFTLGLQFMEHNLGKCARPKVGWQIDPFGHSREHASLLTQMGMDAVFFARIDYRDKDKREANKTMDLLWTSSDDLGSASTIFASDFFRHYSAPYQFCFDVRCNNAPIVIDEESTEYNWEERVNDFTEWIAGMYKSYPTNHLLVPFGDDFRYEAAHNNFINIDRLIEGIHKFNPKVENRSINIIYSTPSCYLKAVHDFVEEKKLTLDVKTDDFFPIADSPNRVWAGYFTSRPTSKRLERYANNLLQVTRQLTSLAGYPNGTNYRLEQAMGIFQHHDAITGTEKTHVEKDYHRRVVAGMNKAVIDDSSSLSKLLGLTDLNLKSCFLANVSICESSEGDEFDVLLYNPLARKTSHYIQIPVTNGVWAVTGPLGEVVDNTLTDSIRDFGYIGKDINATVLEKVLFFRAIDIPALGYKVYHLKKTSNVQSPSLGEDVDQMGFLDTYVNFNRETGLLKSITIKNVTIPVTQQLMYYKSAEGESGAYIFRPDTYERTAEIFPNHVENTVLTNEGNLIREVKQVWDDWVTQIIRIYQDEDFVEFDWAVGPINISDNIGREIISRYSTGIVNVNETFYTDSNGREMLLRKKNYRPTYEYSTEEPEANNYYPVNTRILVRNEVEEFAVITDRSEGGASLESGEIELMLHRALIKDDGKGVGESLNEIEFDQGLVARGSHYVTLGKSAVGNGGRTMAAVERDIAQRKLLQPWVFYTTQEVPIKRQSFLKRDLPENVHLLTLDRWNASPDVFLIRLEHILEKNEDPNLSKEVTVDLSDLFTTFTIKSMKEYMLAANEPLEENSRLSWPQVKNDIDESSPLSKEYRLTREETDLKITLSPMQIRTFVASVQNNL